MASEIEPMPPEFWEDQQWALDHYEIFIHTYG